MRAKIIYSLIIMTLAWGSAFTSGLSKSGSVGAQFLKIPVGSRYQGLGEASTAMVNDAYSLYWNPAGLAQIEGSHITFTNVNWVTDIALNYVAFGTRVADVGTVGFSATLLTMGNMEVTTVEQPEGTGEMFSASSMALSVGFARQLTPRLAFGAAVKYIHEEIYNEKAGGVAFDFGTQLETGFRSLRIGMNIANMGPEMKFSGPDLLQPLDIGTGSTPHGSVTVDPYELPLTFRFGAAYDLVDNIQNRWTVVAEAKQPNDNDQQASVGSEYCFHESYSLRGGYKFNTDEQGLSLGGGVNSRVGKETVLMVDYAWADFGRLESVHRFSIGFSF